MGRALEVLLDISRPSLTCAAHRVAGDIRLDLGDPRAAAEHHRTALDLAVRIGHRFHEAHAAEGLGRASGALGRPAEAAEHRRRSLALFDAMGLPEAVRRRTSGAAEGCF
ncbi:tetratricopeptide repeat protein [Kitasatospora sp. NPDC049258]|uniref:tetratricopeptide repeat protein n=1 Tax=Kitasatospora sp. NPDC049258 TaxID=3155394 RepID=UPI00342625A6